MKNKIFSLLGLLLVLFSLISIHEQSKLEFSNYEVKASVVTKNIATSMVIESINLKLPIARTKIVNGEWEIFEDGVSNLENTNIFYAHNTSERFKNLHNIKIDNQIILFDQNNQATVFKVSEILVVQSNEVEILTQNNEDAIILYTCTGFADTKRLVIKAIKI